MPGRSTTPPRASDSARCVRKGLVRFTQIGSDPLCVPTPQCPICRYVIPNDRADGPVVCVTCGTLLIVAPNDAIELNPAQYRALPEDSRGSLREQQRKVWQHRESWPCESCGAKMVVRNGRRGLFVGCTRFPDCQQTRSYRLTTPCPLDCGGELLARSARDPLTQESRPIVGCSNFRYDAGCNFSVWQAPIQSSCPNCAAPFLVAEEMQVEIAPLPPVGPNRYPKGHCNRCGEKGH